MELAGCVQDHIQLPQKGGGQDRGGHEQGQAGEDICNLQGEQEEDSDWFVQVGYQKCQEIFKLVKCLARLIDDDRAALHEAREDFCSDQTEDFFHTPHKPFVKKNIKRRNLKSVEVNVENVILKPKHSEVVRCENCFISHFPKRKFCKWSMRKKGITQSNNGSFVDAQNKEN